jgi:hypothetical protein
MTATTTSGTTTSATRAGPGTRLRWVLVTVATAAAAAFGFGQPAFVGAVYAASRLLPASCGRPVRLLGGGLAVVVGMVVTATFANPVGIQLPPPLLALTLLTVFAIAAWRWGDHSPSEPRPGDRAIWGAAALGLAMCVPKLIGTTQEHISRLVYGYDNVNHVRMVLTSIRDMGYWWGAPGVGGSLEVGGGYPPALSFLAAYIPWTVRGGFRSPDVDEAIAGASFFFSIQMVLLAVVSVMIVRDIVGDHERAIGRHFGMVSVACLVLLGLAPVVAQRGFQSHAMALLTVVSGLTLLMQRGTSSTVRVGLGAGAIVVASHGWPLAVPALGLPLAYVLLRDRTHLRRNAIVAAALAPVAAYQLVNAPHLVTKTSYLSSQSPAALELPPSTWLVASLVGLAAAVFTSRLGLRRPASDIAGLSVVAALATAGAVAAIQVHNGGGIGGYYLTKTLYLPTLLACALGCGLFGAGAARRFTLKPVVLTLGTMLLLVVWAPLATPWAITHWTNRDPNVLDMHTVEAALVRARAGEATGDLVAMGMCEDITSDYTTRWTGTILQNWTRPREDFVDRVAVEGESLDSLREYALADVGRSITVVARAGCPLADEIRNAGLPNVRVVTTGQ